MLDCFITVLCNFSNLGYSWLILGLTFLYMQVFILFIYFFLCQKKRNTKQIILVVLTELAW